jgi:hypothetical protein
MPWEHRSLRAELLIAQKSLIEPWSDCIAGQRPAMPIVTIADDPSDDEWSRPTLRNAVIALTDRRFLALLADLRLSLHRRAGESGR